MSDDKEAVQKLHQSYQRMKEELSQVIQKMTSLDSEERPTVEDVDLALAQIFEQLSASGATAKFLGSE